MPRPWFLFLSCCWNSIYFQIPDFKTERRISKRTSYKNCTQVVPCLLQVASLVPFMLWHCRLQWCLFHVSHCESHFVGSGSTLAKSSFLNRSYAGKRRAFSRNFSPGNPCVWLGSPWSFLQSAMAATYSFYPCCPGKVSISECFMSKYYPPYFQGKKLSGIELVGAK